MDAFDPIETASRDELQALQLQRLRWSLGHAYANNPRYRAKFDAAAVHPDDLHTLADLAKFPFSTKADLREAYPLGFLAVPEEQLARIHASSGTTGQPTVVAYTKQDLTTWQNLVARSIHAATYYPQTIYYDRNGHIVFDHAGPYESVGALEKDIKRYALG